MSLRDQPYFPFYVQDYLTDERLLMCSWQTQGIYMRILCNLHKQDIYGAILFKQNHKQSSEQNENISHHFAKILCKLIPCQHDEMESAIAELLDNKVLLFDGEKLYQKRMYKDGCLSIKRSEAGKKGGGNPVLKSSKKQKNLFKQKNKQNTENEIESEYEYNIDIYKEEKGGTGGKTSQAKKTNDEFEKFRQEYPGTKRGYTTELKALQKHSDWQDVIPLLKPALDNEIEWRKKLHNAGEFCPQWPHLQTWLNQRRWEQELIECEQRNNKTNNKPSDEYKADILRRLGVDPSAGNWIRSSFD